MKTFIASWMLGAPDPDPQGPQRVLPTSETLDKQAVESDSGLVQLAELDRPEGAESRASRGVREEVRQRHLQIDHSHDLATLHRRQAHTGEYTGRVVRVEHIYKK